MVRVIAVLTAIIVLAATPAAAAEPPADQRVASHTVSEGVVTGTDATSKTIYKQINALNPFGQTLWYWRLERTWTYNGTKVVTAPVYDQTVWIASWAVGWDFKGQVGSTVYWQNCSGNHAHSCHYRKRQVKFQLQLMGEILQTELPWISMKVFYNGGYMIDYEAG